VECIKASPPAAGQLIKLLTKNFGYRTSAIGMSGSTISNHANETGIFFTTLKCLRLCCPDNKA